MAFSSRRGSFREGSLDQYLKEISQYPLIDRDEEVRLAELIHVGDEAALNKLVRSNLRFAKLATFLEISRHSLPEKACLPLDSQSFRHSA